MDNLATRFVNGMTKEQKTDLYRILAGAAFFILGEVFSHTVPFFMGYGALFFFIPGWLTVGAEVLWDALKNIRRSSVLGARSFRSPYRRIYRNPALLSISSSSSGA